MKGIERFNLDTRSTLLMIIDIQEKLCNAMDSEIMAKNIRNVSILLEAANELGVPVLATEQYPAGLGGTLPELKTKIHSMPLDKMSFSCCGEESIMTTIEASGVHSIVVTGMETHICVLQTVLDLLAKGLHVHIVSDGVISRRKSNWRTGLNIAANAGAVVTSTETVLFQLLRKAGTDEFRKLSRLVR